MGLMDARGRVLGLLTCAALVSLCGSAQASPLPPEVSVEPPSGISTGEATLRGQVNPEEQSTTYYFEYGTTAAYGTNVPSAPASAGSGAATVTVSQHIVGLQPGVKYHFRLVAINATETVHSEDSTFAAYQLPEGQSGNCPNEERRAEQGIMGLPECRAYEMVSPLDKNGSNVVATGRMIESSLIGDRVVYPTSAGFGETTGSGNAGLVQNLAVRKEDGGWESHGITPTPNWEGLPSISLIEFSADLRHAIVAGYDLPGQTDDIPNAFNNYLEDTETRALETMTTPLGSGPISPTALAASVRGTSEDLNVVTFETKANLLPTVTGTQPKLYAWEEGVLKVAGVMPDGTLPANGSQAVNGTTAVANRGAISRDGSRVMFSAIPEGSSEPQLYLRRNGETTAWVSEPEKEGAPSQPSSVKFWGMKPDGKKVLFSTEDQLTSEDPGGEGTALYMYTDGPHPESESNLKFIMRGAGSFTGMSDSGNSFYFFAESSPGFPQAGTYLWDEGTIHFVAAMESPLTVYAAGVGASGQVNVSPDGRTLAFVTSQSVNGGPVGLEEGSERLSLYVYDEANETFACASCMPTGQTSVSSAQIEPAAAYAFAYPYMELRPRFLSSDGQRLFFGTADPLVAQDTNGVEDVYEYDIPTKQLSLLSTGTGSAGAWLATMDAEAKNVFIATSQSLLPVDTDTLVDLYDVRVDGGFPQPHVQAGCVGDECQGTPSAAPSFATASGFSGLGNIKFTSTQTASRVVVHLTRKQLLNKALTACKRKAKSKRRGCVEKARERYGAKRSAKKVSKRVGR